MRNLTIIFICIFLFACDPNYEISFLYENKTDSIVYIKSYSLNNAEIIMIEPHSSYLILHHSGMTRAELSLEEYDSIFISKGQEIVKYYRDSSTKNQIYIMDNWIEKKTGKHNYKYIYIIDNELFE